jgi:hypothetical protein
MEKSGAQTGWISYTNRPGGKDHLSPEDRARAENLQAAREQRRGRLLCEVHIRVYEQDVEDAEMYVSFPDDAAMSPDTESEEIALAVARARDQLGRWQ